MPVTLYMQLYGATGHTYTCTCMHYSYNTNYNKSFNQNKTNAHVQVCPYLATMVKAVWIKHVHSYSVYSIIVY